MPAHAMLSRVAAVEGVLGAAVVDAQAGLVIAHVGGLADIEALAEAGVEFWRLHTRLGARFRQEFGSLEAQICLFDRYSLGLIPWPHVADAVLVCVCEKGRAKWAQLLAASR